MCFRVCVVCDKSKKRLGRDVIEIESDKTHKNLQTKLSILFGLRSKMCLFKELQCVFLKNCMIYNTKKITELFCVLTLYRNSCFWKFIYGCSSLQDNLKQHWTWCRHFSWSVVTLFLLKLPNYIVKLVLCKFTELYREHLHNLVFSWPRHILLVFLVDLRCLLVDC